MQSLLASIAFGLLFATTVLAADRASITVVVDKNCLSPLSQKLVAQHKILLPTRFEAFSSDQDSVEEWQSNPCVLATSLNSRVLAASQPVDPLSELQLGLRAIQHSNGAKFFYHPLFGIRQRVISAIVDTGIQASHPDLAPRLWRGANGETGFNVLTGTADTSDDNGHGTHVAGILGAQRGNGVGIQGVMGEQVLIMAVKALDESGGGTITDLVNGILWAADHGAEVINLSLASQGANSALQTAIEYALSKNAVIVTAAGNQGAQISNANFVVPAAYSPSYDGLLSVGAIDAISLLRPSYSNFSANFVELAAPGSEGVDGLLSTSPTSSYKRDRGTSVSSPHVAGAASLAVSFLKTHGFPVSNAIIEDLLKKSGKPNPDLITSVKDGKMLDLERLGRILFYSTVIDSSGGFDD